eukprot:gene17647-8819_t
MAVIVAIERGPARVEVRTDSQYVYDGCLLHRPRWRVNGWRLRAGSARWIENAELWRRLDQAWTARPAGAVRLRKVKGHATVEDVARGRVTAFDRWGNNAADAHATAGAAQHAAPPEMVRAARWRKRTAAAVQRMMVAIAVERSQISRQSAGHNA